MRNPRKFPDLCTYSSQSNNTQLAIINYLISCVRDNSQFYINTVNDVESYKFAKIINLNINQSSVDLIIQSLSNELIELPIDLLVSIEPMIQNE